MTWLGILKLLLSLASGLTAYLRERKLMDAGRALATIENLKQAQKEIAHAEEIRRRVRDDIADNGLPDDDPFRRD